ncbi:putative quinol monooxygenase [Glutamicibacter endophyticus]|uniref:putative quinol monooxygenase n=1 Tax=Glutamicibacter endophyticus TaxID=1522174 RepID=UPI003AF1C33F
MAQIKLIGTLHCSDAHEADIVRRNLPLHQRLTHDEPGCLKFEVVPTASELVWEVNELFSDRAAFDAHQARTAASTWGQATAGIRRDYEIVELPGN